MSARATATSDQVIVERRDGTAGRHVADVHGAAAIEFGPTGSELAFVAPDRPGREVALPVGPLRLMDATTGEVRVILTGSVIAFFWAPDGRRIAALQIAAPTRRTRSPRSMDRVRRSSRAPEPGARWRRLPAWRCGSCSSIPRRATSSPARPIQAGAVFAAHILPYFDQYALSHRFWSSDSRSVALPVAAEDGTEGIVVFPADGGAATRVADGVAAAWGP